MKLSAKQVSILNDLPKYEAALKRSQIGAKDGGDIRLGDALNDKSEKPTAIVAVDPNTVTLHDLAVAYNALLAALKA